MSAIKDIGLIPIREIYKYSLDDLGEKLGVSRQTIWKWENGKKKIPQKRLVELSQVFGLPEEYFIKELTDDEKGQIQQIRLQQEKEKIDREIAESAMKYNYVDTIKDEETGEEIEINVEGVYPDYKLVGKANHNQFQIEEIETINRIKKTLEPKINNENEGLSFAYTELENYKLLAEILESDKVNPNIINKILKGIALKYNVIEELDIDPIVEDILKMLEQQAMIKKNSKLTRNEL